MIDRKNKIVKVAKKEPKCKIFDPKDYLQQATSAAETIAEQLKRLSVDEQKLAMGEVIWAYCFEDERKEAYF
ncbi:hypothetical protein EfmAA242_12540 [Enterococcus faecium]|nr:hypothetical protein EfmAA242_12540 [Enterococcus faecium]